MSTSKPTICLSLSSSSMGGQVGLQATEIFSAAAAEVAITAGSRMASRKRRNMAFSLGGKFLRRNIIGGKGPPCQETRKKKGKKASFFLRDNASGPSTAAEAYAKGRRSALCKTAASKNHPVFPARIRGAEPEFGKGLRRGPARSPASRFLYSRPIFFAMDWAARRPAPMARITVAAPVTISPPAYTLGMEVSPFSSTAM